MCAPVADARCACVLVTVAYRTLGHASPPVLLPTCVAKALLCWRSLGWTSLATTYQQSQTIQCSQGTEIALLPSFLSLIMTLISSLCRVFTAGLALDPTWGRVNFSCRRARNHRQEVGQVAWTFPQSARGRSQNENRSRTSARAHGGVVSANEKKEKRKKENFW
jgi:hypothetical protein